MYAQQTCGTELVLWYVVGKCVCVWVGGWVGVRGRRGKEEWGEVTGDEELTASVGYVKKDDTKCSKWYR